MVSNISAEAALGKACGPHDYALRSFSARSGTL
jgi:hypothetical protein